MHKCAVAALAPTAAGAAFRGGPGESASLWLRTATPPDAEFLNSVFPATQTDEFIAAGSTLK
jgi:hypothetical protein